MRAGQKYLLAYFREDHWLHKIDKNSYRLDPAGDRHAIPL